MVVVEDKVSPSTLSESVVEECGLLRLCSASKHEIADPRISEHAADAHPLNW